MIRNILAALLLGLALFGVVIWYFDIPIPLLVEKTDYPPPQEDTEHGKVDYAKLGDDLYPAAPFPAIHLDPTKPLQRDPIVLRGFMTIKDKQEVPSNVPGQ